MAFSNEELARITDYTGQMGEGRHGKHVTALGEKVKQGDQDAFNRLTRMNAYLRQFPGFEEALYDIPQLGEPFDKAKLAQISGYDQSPMYRILSMAKVQLIIFICIASFGSFNSQ